MGRFLDWNGVIIRIMKRQGLPVTINQLRHLADKLESQARQDNLELGLEDEGFVDEDTKFQINIINKTPECSDTWEIEG